MKEQNIETPGPSRRFFCPALPETLTEKWRKDSRRGTQNGVESGSGRFVLLSGLGAGGQILDQGTKDKNPDQGFHDHDEDFVDVMTFFPPEPGRLFVIPTSGRRELHARTFLLRTVRGMGEEGEAEAGRNS